MDLPFSGKEVREMGFGLPIWFVDDGVVVSSCFENLLRKQIRLGKITHISKKFRFGIELLKFVRPKRTQFAYFKTFSVLKKPANLSSRMLE